MATKRKAEPGTVLLSCVQCGSTKTPQWREGPMGPKTLCNACGVKWLRQLKRAREEAVPTKVHATRRVRLSPSSHHAGSRELPALDGMHMHGDSSDDAAWPANEEDELAAANLLTFAGVQAPMRRHDSMDEDEEDGEEVHAAPGGDVVSGHATHSLVKHEHDSAITFHLPIPRLGLRMPPALPPPGSQLIIPRRVAVRKPLVYAPLPAAFQMATPSVVEHGAVAAVGGGHEDEQSELADANNATAAVTVQQEAQPAHSLGSQQETASQQLAQPPLAATAAATAAACAPGPAAPAAATASAAAGSAAVVPSAAAGLDTRQLLQLQAAVVDAFAELQAADAARVATLQCLARTQEAADSARRQALACAEKLLVELAAVSAQQKGQQQPPAAAAAATAAATAAAAPTTILAHAVAAAAMAHAASPVPLAGH